MVTGVGSNNISFGDQVGSFLQSNNVNSLVSKAVSTAIDLNSGNTTAALRNLGDLFTGIGSQLSGTPQQGATSNPLPANISKLFGNDNAFAAENERQNNAARSAAAGGANGNVGGIKSLGALLALVGSILTKAMENTFDQLANAAKQLDSATQSGGPTAQLNQKIQEMTFNLQQIQQTLNRVNETVTNLSRSQSDAQKSVTQNLSV